MDTHVDVVVVGAGPVGLLLAIELQLGGAGVLVVERLPGAAPRPQGAVGRTARRRGAAAPGPGPAARRSGRAHLRGDGSGGGSGAGAGAPVPGAFRPAPP